MAKEYPDELCELSPTAFFYPTWTESHLEYMHTELGPRETAEFKKNFRLQGGAIYENQMAYHAAYGAEWIKEMTPEVVKQKDTPFNILVRQFLD